CRVVSGPHGGPPRPGYTAERAKSRLVWRHPGRRVAILLNPLMPAVLILVTGSVLGWAITDAGYSPVEVAAMLGVPLTTVQSWINGTAHPTKGQFDKLISLLGRPESFFFLAQPPTSTSSTARYRRTPGTGTYAPSPEDLKAIRLARDLQRVARWIAERRDERPDVAIAKVADPPEKVAEELRLWLGWSTKQQLQ